MDIHQLQLFVALARNLHFGQTSFEMHMSPSAVSRTLQRLEDQVGQTLFLRDNRSVKLTEAGQIFREYADEVLSRHEQLLTELGESEGQLRGRLTLFASVTASQSILPTVLSRFREDYPGIHLQLETGYAVNALARLHEGCDVVVAALSQREEPELHKRIITSIPVLMIAPCNAPGFDEYLSGDIDWPRIPMIVPTAGQARDNLDNWIRKASIRPNIYAEVAGNEAILSLVALGCGVGFVPELVLHDSPLVDKVKVIESGPRLEDFHVGFCSRRRSLENSPIVQAFWSSIPALP